MAAPITLTQVDSRRTDSLDVGGNLVITSRGSLAVTNALYALKILGTANQLAATVNGGITLTTNENTVFGIQILAADYTVKVGSFRPNFQLTVNGKTTNGTAQGKLISGNALTLGSASDPAAFGATLSSTVNANGNIAQAYSYAIVLGGRLTVASQQFSSVVTSSARSAAGSAYAYGIDANEILFAGLTAAAKFNVSATAGNKLTEQDAVAIAITAENGIATGAFGAAVTVNATGGSGTVNVNHATAVAFGIRSVHKIELGLFSNAFTVNAKSGKVAGSDAEANAITFVEDSSIAGFAAGFKLTATATGVNDAIAKGISGNADLLISGALNGNWSAVANGGDGYSGTTGMAFASMIDTDGGLQLEKDLNAVITVRATGNRGQNGYATAIEAAAGISILGQTAGSITVEAKVTGTGTVVRSAALPQAYAAGIQTSGDAIFSKGFAANFRLNASAAGLDSAEAYGLVGSELNGDGALAGNWTVSATSTGGQNSAGYAGKADAYGIYAENDGVCFYNYSGSGKLTLTVSASGNTANLTSVSNAVANAYGIKAGSNIELAELGMLTVSAKAGKAGVLSSASAVGMRGTDVILERLSGANITANAASEAWASVIQASMDITVDNFSGAYRVTASSSAGRAFATGFEVSNMILRAATSGSSLTVRATGGVGVLNSWTDAAATGVSGGLSVAGTFSALTVAATSGRGGVSNNANAYGVYADGGSAFVETLGTVNVSASAVQAAEAFGFYADTVTVKQLNGAWSVTAASSTGSAQAHGVSGDFSCTQAKAAVTVRATGGTSAPGGNSSATAIGIRGNVFYALPTLNVTAISGKNATTNNATAYGVYSNEASGAISGLRRINIVANAVDQAEAGGYRNVQLSGFDSHVENVSALSTNSFAFAVGYQDTTAASPLSAALAGTLSVSARGVTSAHAIGIKSTGSVELDSSASAVQKMTITANSSGGDTVAAAIVSPSINLDNGLFANWTATATGAAGAASAALFCEATDIGRVGGLNGVFAVSATGRAATANGFVSAGGTLDSANRKLNFSLTVNAKATGGAANADGIAFSEINFDSLGFRDTITVVADGYSTATASGFRNSASTELAVNTNSQFSLSVTARSTAGTALAFGFTNVYDKLSLSIGGTVNLSATGGRTTTDADVSANATGIGGGLDSYNSVYILQTFNVTAKSGSGSGFADDMTASAIGVNFLSSDSDTSDSSFEAASQTRMTVKADAVGFASATGVSARYLEFFANTGTINVISASSGNRAQAVGAVAVKSLKINQGSLKLTVSATGGKTVDPLEKNNAVAFGMVSAGNWDVDGNLLSSTNSVIICNYSATVLDGLLTVSAKASSGANAGSGKAHAAAFAAEEVQIGSFASTFKANVRAETADKRARAFGIQGSGSAASFANGEFEGVWTVAAVSGSGTAEAYGIGATAVISLASQFSQSKLLVSAEADGIASAYGFSSSAAFGGWGLALAVTVSATSRKNGAAEAIGIRTAEVAATVGGNIAATASGGTGSLAIGIAASGTLQIDGVVAAATAKNGDAYAIRGDLASGIALNLVVNGAIYGGRNGNAVAVANQLAGLVKSGGGAASLLGSIKPTAAGGAYYAVSGTTKNDSVRLANNAISVGDISLGGGTDTLTLSATSQVIGNIGSDVETITFLINSAPGKNPIITVRDSAGALDSKLFATADNAQLGTYILAQGASTDIGAMTGVSLVVNGSTELFLNDTGSRLLGTGAYGRLSLVTTGKVSKLMLQITSDALGTPPAGGNYVPPTDINSLAMPQEELPLAAGSSGLSFEEDFRLYGVGAADLLLGASDALYVEERNADSVKKGLLAG